VRIRVRTTNCSHVTLFTKFAASSGAVGNVAAGQKKW
jgi:hypothetical protein